MTPKQREIAFDKFTKKQKEILCSKSHDYALEDVHSNFKLAGGIVGSDAKMNCLHLIAVKVARLGALMSTGKKPNNEAISDTLVDLANYTFILDCLENDG